MRPLRYSFSHSHFGLLHSRLQESFLALPNVPLPRKVSSLALKGGGVFFHRFGVLLSSLPFSAHEHSALELLRFLDTDGCFQAYRSAVFVTPYNLPTEKNFGTLTGGLGCFPLDLGASPPRSVYVSSAFVVFGVYFPAVRTSPPYGVQCSTPTGAFSHALLQ